MASAWGKPLTFREPTKDELAATAKAQAKGKADEAAKALLARAEKLVDKIEAVIATRGGGVSSNYGLDEQYSVNETWSKTESSLALTQWKLRFPNGGAGLGIHKLGPSQKHTGGRNGAHQFNFIRKISGAGNSRFNVHANWNGKD